MAGPGQAMPPLPRRTHERAHYPQTREGLVLRARVKGKAKERAGRGRLARPDPGRVRAVAMDGDRIGHDRETLI